jgi:hypothetical protein
MSRQSRTGESRHNEAASNRQTRNSMRGVSTYVPNLIHRFNVPCDTPEQIRETQDSYAANCAVQVSNRLDSPKTC